jgi:hypothetical protein
MSYNILMLSPDYNRSINYTIHRLNSLTQPFPISLPIYYPLMGKTIEGDVTNLDYRLVQKMRINSAAEFGVKVNDMKFPIQLAKASSMLFVEAIKFKPNDKPTNEFKLEAGVYRQEVISEHLKQSKLLKELRKDPGGVVYFDLVAKFEKEHFPPLRAKKFIEWALELFVPHDPLYILGQWLPESDNHAAYFKSKQEHRDPLQAIKNTWSYKQFTRLNYQLIPIIDEIDAFTEKASPYGYPQVVVQTLFKKQF